MRLSSARQAWHDAYYTPWDSSGAHVEQLGRMGCSVQKTERAVNARSAMHQALSARIQWAIATLPISLQTFGHWLYSPLAGDDQREIAEEMVLQLAVAEHKRMTAATFERARYVAAGVVYRYRRQNQGGQGEGADPLPTGESFRQWLDAQHGVVLRAESWARDWDEFVELCFCACNTLDKAALAPVAVAVSAMNAEAA